MDSSDVSATMFREGYSGNAVKRRKKKPFKDVRFILDRLLFRLSSGENVDGGQYEDCSQDEWRVEEKRSELKMHIENLGGSVVDDADDTDDHEECGESDRRKSYGEHKAFDSNLVRVMARFEGHRFDRLSKMPNRIIGLPCLKVGCPSVARSALVPHCAHLHPNPHLHGICFSPILGCLVNLHCADTTSRRTVLIIIAALCHICCCVAFLLCW